MTGDGRCPPKPQACCPSLVALDHPAATMSMLIMAQALLGRLRSVAGSSDPAASQEVGLQASQLFDCLSSYDPAAEDPEAWR